MNIRNMELHDTYKYRHDTSLFTTWILFVLFLIARGSSGRSREWTKKDRNCEGSSGTWASPISVLRAKLHCCNRLFARDKHPTGTVTGNPSASTNQPLRLHATAPRSAANRAGNPSGEVAVRGAGIFCGQSSTSRSTFELNSVHQTKMCQSPYFFRIRVFKWSQ